MPVHIGEVRNEIEAVGPAPSGPTSAPAAARIPRWSDRERHRAVTEALARDAARVGIGERHG